MQLQRRAFVFALAAGSLWAAEGAQTADAILDEARSQANGRAVFVIFHASW